MTFLQNISDNRKYRTALLCLSICGLYLLPHYYENTFLVGLGFAFIQSLSCRPLAQKKALSKRLFYALISLGTYFILFQDQPWEFMSGRFRDDLPSLLPVAICSVIMSLAGSALLLRGVKQKVGFIFITLALQLPLCHFYEMAPVKASLRELGDMLFYTDKHTGDMQAWQLIWLLNYYLPIYLFPANHKMKIHTKKEGKSEMR